VIFRRLQAVLTLAAVVAAVLVSTACAGSLRLLATTVVISKAAEGQPEVQAQAHAEASRDQRRFPPPFPYRQFDPDSAVRLEVTPREAEVYVDGYYAGIVDDFDGVFQRLRLMSGGHEITIYRDGYRSFTQKVYLTPDHTLRIRHRMEPLGPGEVGDARPTPPESPQIGEPLPPGVPVFPRGPDGRRAPSGPPGAPPQDDRTAPPESGTGTLALRIDPADSTLVIDGEPWQGPAGIDRLIELPEGQHTIQVSKRGYVSFLTEIRVRRGETSTLDVTLRANPS
jgi:hypothetical protein